MRLAPAALAFFLAAPAFAQSPPNAAPPPPPAPAAAAAQNAEEPTVEERRLVAFVATGVSVVSLATGVTFGVLAQGEFDCAKDVLACNKTLNNKIVGTELFDVRREIEQKALAADMAYLFAIASGVVATAGYLSGFVFADEGATSSLTPPPVIPVKLAEVTR